jgi:phosphoserine phosphatase/predicted alpha/beta hydrolase family esterase
MGKQLVYFVHGLDGDHRVTWGRFPELIRKDPDLKDTFDIGFFSYPTSLFSMPWSKKYPKVQTLADALRTEIDMRFKDYTSIILVCHSLGGLIARKYLLEEVKSKRPLRVQGVLLYAVPNNGASIAKIGQQISRWHNQIRQLCKDADLIRDLSTDWFTFKLKDAVQVKCVIAALDRIVDEESARQFWGNPDIATLSDRGHRDVVKPRSNNDTTYLILKQFLLSGGTEPSPSVSIQRYATPSRRTKSGRPKNSKFHVIGFDLDGTLLRGYQYSWTLVWNYLEVQPAVWKEALRNFVTGKRTFSDYKAWCEHDYLHMRAKGLRKEAFAEITRGVTATKNLVEALRTLRTEGFVLALISGGIDTFLEQKIPNANQLFDYICINRLKYDDQSMVCGIEPTPFDFAGKAVALETICKEYGVTLAEAVFVGEGNNDEDVANAAGLSIAYPPHGQVIPAASRVEVADDDLLKILDHVLT